MADRRPVTGWGRSTRSDASLVRGVGIDDLRRVVTESTPRGVLARGMGRSYNDSAQNAGGVLVDTGRRHIELDPSTGIVDVGSAVSLDELMRSLLPHGWFVPVTPGTRLVSVGGAIASDVHGKNHHVDGSIGVHLESLDLMTPDGAVRTVAPADPASAAVFWATVGGLGLTGLVLSCRLRCTPVESSRVLVETVRTRDLDHTMRVLVDADERTRYSVAWVDLIAGGAALGRGVVTLGDHAPAESVTAGDPLTFSPDQLAAVPPWYDVSLLNRLTIRAFNELWYRKAPKHRVDELQPISAFFHPLDMLGRWNRLYGRRGFVQYQMVVPDEAAETVRATIETLVGRRVPSFLAVLKRFGAANEAPLSFPKPGWTLALDIPAGVAGLPDILDELDAMVLEAGGRVYLAKDGRVAPELVEAMYPRLDEWRAVVDELDPDHRICSDLDRRLGLRRRSP